MKTITDLDVCGNLFNSITDTGLALGALNDALQAIDMSLLEERHTDLGTFLRGIGYLIQVISDDILVTTDMGLRHSRPASAVEGQ